MIPWVEAGVRAAIESYSKIRGFKMPTSLPALGPQTATADIVVGSLEVNSFFTVERKAFTITSPWWTVGIAHSGLRETCNHLTLRDCSIEGATKWGSRSYRMREDNEIVRCAFRNTWPEHDIYWNLAGYGDGADSTMLSRPALILRNSYFEHTGSQNLQLVQRATDWYGPTPAEDLTPGGSLIVQDVISRDAGCGIDHPRGEEGSPYEGDPRSAFAFSFFASQNDVLINRLLVDKTMQKRSSGCLLVEKRNRCVVNASAFLSSDTNQPIAIFRDIDDLTIKGTWFQASAGQNRISIENCKKVTIDGCGGTAHVLRDGKDVGVVGEVVFK